MADAGPTLMAFHGATSTPGSRSLNPSSRTDVLWIGGAIPKSLTAALMVRYDIVSITPTVDAVDAAASTARAILIEVLLDTTDLAWTHTIIDNALDHGLVVVFTSPDLPDGECEVARHHCFEMTKPLVNGSRTRAHYNDWAKIAAVVEAHDPKGGCSRALQFTGEPVLDPIVEILIRRAFYDFAGLTLELIQGGKSGAGVCIVRPSVVDRGRRSAPFLIKWNTLDKMRMEKSNVIQYAANSVSFRLTPPLHEARCIEGSTKALLVFDFIDRAASFASAIQTYPAGQIIGSLFDHTLAGCLAAAADCNSDVVASYDRHGLTRWSDELHAVACHATLVDASALSSAVLAARLRSLGPIHHRVSTMHADMHVLNLLVATGSSDVLLIDFGKMTPDMPVVADAACLEVSLTFPTDEARVQLQPSPPSIDQDWLEQAYAYPLEPHRIPARDDRERWVPDAIRAIRGAARQHEPNSTSYTLAIVVYLFRYASFPDNGSLHDRVLAYRLVCRLVTKVDEALAMERFGGERESDAA